MFFFYYFAYKIFTMYFIGYAVWIFVPSDILFPCNLQSDKEQHYDYLPLNGSKKTMQKYSVDHIT